MTTHSMTVDTNFAFESRRAGLARLRRGSALALGWIAYGVFYVTVLGAMVGVPAAVAFYLIAG